MTLTPSNGMSIRQVKSDKYRGKPWTDFTQKCFFSHCFLDLGRQQNGFQCQVRSNKPWIKRENEPFRETIFRCPFKTNCRPADVLLFHNNRTNGVEVLHKLDSAFFNWSILTLNILFWNQLYIPLYEVGVISLDWLLECCKSTSIFIPTYFLCGF